MALSKQMITRRVRLSKIYQIASEEVMEYVALLVALVQFVSCFGFYPDMGEYYVPAVWGFIITSVVNLFINVQDLYDSIEFLEKHVKPKITKAEEEELGHHERETLEGAIFTTSTLTFIVGSVFFLPSVYELSEEFYLTMGTWLFFIGSLLLVFATYINSLNISVHGRFFSDLNPKQNQLAVLSLFWGLAGSISYSIGCVGFFPEFAVDGEKWNPLTAGTDAFVLGALFYVVEGITNILNARVKHEQERGENGRLETSVQRIVKSLQLMSALRPEERPLLKK